MCVYSLCVVVAGSMVCGWRQEQWRGGGGRAGRKGVGVAAVSREVDSRLSAVAGCCTGEKQVRELNKNTCIVCIKTGPNKNRLFFYFLLCVLCTLFNCAYCAFFCLIYLIFSRLNCYFFICIYIRTVRRVYVRVDINRHG